MSGIREIAFARPWITDAELDAVVGVLGGDVLTHGPQAKAFEEEFSEFMGGDGHALLTSSGMAALHLAYWQLGIGSGDEVIVTSQTHVATVHAVEIVGATPVFVDCRQADGNIDPAQIEEAVTDRTRAIGLVHFVGIPCDMDSIMEIARRSDLLVIEDCALAVGARVRDTHVGLIGDAGIFSFYPVKHITTGDGGMFVTRHVELKDRVASARAFGVDRSFSERAVPGKYDAPTLGLNYRLSDINAAIGRQQLARIDEVLQRRADNFRVLRAGLSDIPDLHVIDTEAVDRVNSHYCLSVVLGVGFADHRDKIAQRLRENGVGTSIYYPHPIPRLSYYKDKYGHDLSRVPQATTISDNSIALPVGPHLDESDMEYIATQLIRVMESTD
ncbi:MAG: DegT/DnrJ/EryC1/StrS family aminotransferase [Acidimicrobiales bacterium]|nr:DegT/DnrJ/EryC1/StrS family aminotransferase [Acidimicrobiales bacterium]